MSNILVKGIKEAAKILCGKRRVNQSVNLLKYRLAKRKLTVNYKPIYLTILPIHRCNLACKMCLTHSKELGDHPYRHQVFQDMSIDMFRDIIKKFPEALAVGFVGNGEPLLNKDILRMIDYAESIGKMHTSMISNGVVLGDFIDDILNSKLSEICISINGHNPNEFNRMTGIPEKYFGTIIESSKKLIDLRNKKQSNLRIVASIIIDRDNLSSIQDMIDFAGKTGFDHTSFYNILPLTVKRAEQSAIFSEKKTVSVLLKTTPHPSMTHTLPIPLKDCDQNNVCDDFFTCINIDGEGNVGGCNRQRFNIKETGKYWDKNVWNNEYFTDEREKFCNPSMSLDEPCRVCSANSSFVKNSLETFIEES